MLRFTPLVIYTAILLFVSTKALDVLDSAMIEAANNHKTRMQQAECVNLGECQ